MYFCLTQYQHQIDPFYLYKFFFCINGHLFKQFYTYSICLLVFWYTMHLACSLALSVWCCKINCLFLSIKHCVCIFNWWHCSWATGANKYDKRDFFFLSGVPTHNMFVGKRTGILCVIFAIHFFKKKVCASLFFSSCWVYVFTFYIKPHLLTIWKM